jgi:acyl-CoA dehydrogenase
MEKDTLPVEGSAIDPAVLQQIRSAVRDLCKRFPGAYWRELDRSKAYPAEFVQAMTEAGYLGVLIPEEFGGSSLGLTAAAAILEEVHASGGNAAALHAQMYTMGTVLRHGSAEQKQRWLPEIAAGRLRLQAFAVTEPGAGTDTTAIRTTAVRRGEAYRINGQKIWTSRAEHSDLMLLLARTAPFDPAKKTAGLSVFLVDMREAGGRGMEIRPIRTMLNHATTEVFFDNLEIPAENRIGEEGRGFLIAAECLGDCRWFVGKARDYACERVVFGRPIGQNQGVQFPIARSYAECEAVRLMVYRAAALYDAGIACGPEANMAKLLASEASWRAADTCLQTHGGFGFAEEFDVERKFREARLYQVAPVSTNLILAYLGEHVLGMPRSY